MASLHFIYSAMNAGKTTSLLQAAFNYKERDMTTMLLKSKIDTRDSVGVIESRIGLKAPCHLFGVYCDLFELVASTHQETPLSCVLVDEAQFMEPKQVDELAKVVDDLKIPVMCYGLRSDFQGNVFPASSRLFTVADKLREQVVVCACSKKATHVLRMDSKGNVVVDGQQVEVGGNDKYVSVCRKCHRREMAAAFSHREFAVLGHRIQVISVRDDITGDITALKSPLDVTHLFKIDDRTKTVWPRKLVLSNLAAAFRDNGEQLGAVDWGRVTFGVVMLCDRPGMFREIMPCASVMPQEFDFDPSAELEVHEFYTWAEGKTND